MYRVELTFPHSLGRERAYALHRDQARKFAYYGHRVEITDRLIAHFRAEGRIDIRVTEAAILVHAELTETQRDRRDQLIDRIVRPSNVPDSVHVIALPYRIFGTGPSRTGTTSLHRALGRLGIFGLHHAPWLFPEIRHNIRIIESVGEYTALVDSPFSYLYRELDQAYPGSKFIHTDRDPHDWIESFRWLMGNASTPMSRWFYGIDRFDESRYIEKFLAHREKVEQHFQGRPESLLMMNIGKGDGWEKLCDFLDLPIPDEPFPDAHRRSGNMSRLARQAPLVKPCSSNTSS